MRITRILSTTAVVAAITGVAVLVVAMGAAPPAQHDPASPTSSSSQLAIPLQYVSVPTADSTTSPAATATPSASSASPSVTPSLTPTAQALAPTTAARPAPTGAASTSSSARPAPRPTSASTSPTAAPVRGVSLPLGYSTGTATRVITVVASSQSSTVATLQAWVKAPGGGWLRWGSAITAHVGSQGLTTAPSESKSATPIGSFTLTEAFGHDANPGTALPYRQTTPADWWISQSGSLYNTEQHCSSGCSFTQGSPNEHLYYETPYYNYAVVIDYNRFPVHQGAGSAFFLHVTDGSATAGCIAIPQSNLVTLMTSFLTPATHPRILIGVT